LKLWFWSGGVVNSSNKLMTLVVTVEMATEGEVCCVTKVNIMPTK
jgi:hypothetical protein